MVTGGGPSFRAYAQATAPTTPTALAEQWRALSRIGYGPTPGLRRAVQAQGPRAWALQQIELASTASQTPPVITTDLAEFNAPLPDLFDGARRERLARAAIKSGNADKEAPSGLRRLVFDSPTPDLHFSGTIAQKAAAWRLDACSLPEQENPLLARITEFWFNHLNVYVGKGAVRPFVGHYVANVARAHALGKFEDLILASARHPAMLLYLDQARSVAEGSRGPEGTRRGLNENYARELMELHTLGVAGGYTQADVRELARVLTGWTVGPNDADGFRFAPRQHDTGTKRVLDHTYPEHLFGGGEREGEQVIRMLARHPRTAQRVCLRLAQFFVADNPPPELVARLARTFLDTQGELRAVLRTLFESDAFWAPGHTLFKTPMDFACAALTAARAALQRDAALPTDRRLQVLTLGFLAQAGQPLHGWQTPDGYRFDTATWLAPEALTRRADYALALTRPVHDLDFLQPYLNTTTRESIAQERPALRAGLVLASPELQYK